MSHRYDIKTEDIIQKWNDRLSLTQIAKDLGCSVDTVENRLEKAGIERRRGHSEGALRHYDTEADGLWPVVKLSLDEGKNQEWVCKAYSLSKDRFLALCERHGYDYETEFREKLDEADLLLKSEIQALRDAGKTVKEIASHYHKGERTMAREMRRLGLTKKADRTDIKDEDVVSLWEDGLTIMEIADHFQCSHDTITKRLKAKGISCGRAAGIERHFDRVHGADWPDIKKDLDAFMPVSSVAVKHSMRYEAVYRMMESNNYQYAGMQDFDEDSVKGLLSASRDEEEHVYLQAMLDYYGQYQNTPVVYTLSRFMGKGMKEVRAALSRHGLTKFIGSSGSSAGVQHIIRELDRLGIRYELNNRKILRKPDGRFLEIDIYLPDYRLGIEVNPTWTHSCDIDYNGISEDYHQVKALLAEEKGVGLLYMYDSDFLTKGRFDVFLSQMEALAGSKQAVGARQCQVKEISSKPCNKFLEKYHFQGGERSSSKRYGLFYQDALVGVLCVGKSRYTGAPYEIIRYCMDPRFIIHGCFQKLFRHFLKGLKKPCDIVSFMDLNKRMRPGNVYEKNGFTLDGITPPDYIWSNRYGTDVRSRYACMKHKLVAQGADPSKSEAQIMHEAGFYRVYGAGSKRYVYHYGP